VPFLDVHTLSFTLFLDVALSVLLVLDVHTLSFVRYHVAIVSITSFSRKKTEKHKLFSNHNMSPLRQQPRAMTIGIHSEVAALITTVTC